MSNKYLNGVIATNTILISIDIFNFDASNLQSQRGWYFLRSYASSHMIQFAVR